jgi:type IV pilus assembly protein PilW
MKTRLLPPHGSRRSMAGVSMVEMMIAVTLGLLIMAALASIFASSSATRAEIERNSRQIENGRYAIEVLSDELRLAGFYGELNTSIAPLPATMPDVCSNDPADWKKVIQVHVYAWDQGLNVPTCVPLKNHKPDTDVLLVRRVATCTVGSAGCEPMVVNAAYLQVARCNDDHATNNIYDLNRKAGGWTLRLKDCINAAPLRRYIQRIYYIAMDNGTEPIPSLRRIDFDGFQWVDEPTTIVDGIEFLNIEYGIDWAPLLARDGFPETYSVDPTSQMPAGCPVAPDGCNEVRNWANVVTARIHLLARNIEPSRDYEDKKIYTLGHTTSGNEFDVAPGGAYRRHVYSSLVRVVNSAQRREQPD